MSSRTLGGVVLLAMAVGGGLWLRPSVDRWIARPAPPASSIKAARYQCPMHPQIVSDHPEKCPICGMDLNPVTEGPGAAPEGRVIVGYRHPMRPDVTSPTPAVDEMGMPYVPIYAGETGGEVPVPGHAAFTLPAERQQLIGVTHEAVARRPLELSIRAVGKVAYDPKLYEALVEYRQAQRALGEMRQSPWTEAREGASSLVRAAALKLRQQGVSDELLRVMSEGADPTTVLLPGSSVWIYVQVTESEVALVQVGQRITITAPAFPGRRFTAAVAGVDPILDPTTRSARVRALVATPQAELKPEMFVDATIEVPLGERLAVPTAAVLDTGPRQIVFVVSGAGRFAPRLVQLGHAAQGYYEVLDGLAEGEQIVTSANFLIDSESRFRAALAGFGGGEPR